MEQQKFLAIFYVVEFLSEILTDTFLLDDVSGPDFEYHVMFDDISAITICICLLFGSCALFPRNGTLCEMEMEAASFSFMNANVSAILRKVIDSTASLSKCMADFYLAAKKTFH